MNLLLKQLDALLDNTNETISILANASAFLNEVLEDISWVGFYIWKEEELILGPFQGKTACVSIPKGKGVCGACAKQKQSIIVPNVHEFVGHIACDFATNSEIVIPMMKDHKLYGVLDIDSTSLNRFHKQDQAFLEACVSIIMKKLAFASSKTN